MGELCQVTHTVVSQRQKVLPRRLSERVERLQEVKIPQRAGKSDSAFHEERDMEFVITNNPKVLSVWPSARWIEGGPREVFLECRKRVQEGCSLLSHPLMGDIHLLQNPFRTVILDGEKGEIDLTSLAWIEESMERVRLFFRESRGRRDSEDYQSLDLDLFRGAARRS